MIFQKKIFYTTKKAHLKSKTFGFDSSEDSRSKFKHRNEPPEPGSGASVVLFGSEGDLSSSFTTQRETWATRTCRWRKLRPESGESQTDVRNRTNWKIRLPIRNRLNWTDSGRRRGTWGFWFHLSRVGAAELTCGVEPDILPAVLKGPPEIYLLRWDTCSFRSSDGNKPEEELFFFFFKLKKPYVNVWRQEELIGWQQPIKFECSTPVQQWRPNFLWREGHIW